MNADRMFRAFADLTRLRILRVLRRGETCVGDVVAALRLPQARVSRHLAYLRRAGLVRRRVAGHWAHYSLAPARGALQRRLLRCLDSCFRDLAPTGRRGRSCCPPLKGKR